MKFVCFIIACCLFCGNVSAQTNPDPNCEALRSQISLLNLQIDMEYDSIYQMWEQHASLQISIDVCEGMIALLQSTAPPLNSPEYQSYMIAINELKAQLASLKAQSESLMLMINAAEADIIDMMIQRDALEVQLASLGC